MAKLPTVVLRHKISGVKRIMNAAEYALKVGGISREWRLVEYRGTPTRDEIVERAVREAEVEWKKTRDGRDDRPERRYEERAIKQNIVVSQDADATPAPAAPSEEAVAASGNPATTSQESTPAPATPPVQEPLLGPADGLIAPPKKGRGRPRKSAD